MRLRSWRRQHRRVDLPGGRWCAGAISAELALVAPVLILLFMGMWDFGRALNESARLASAANAGAQYAAQGLVYAEATFEIDQAVRYDAEDSSSALTVDVVLTCQCPSGGSVECSGSCATGALQTFVQVQVTESFSTWFTYPFVSNPMTLSKQATWRVL